MKTSSAQRWLVLGLFSLAPWVGCGAPDAAHAPAGLAGKGDVAAPCASLGLCVHVDLSTQRLWAYDDSGELALQATVATGRLATPTHAGDFSITTERPTAQVMRGPNGDGTWYAVPTKWVQYFHQRRAFHSIDSVGNRDSYFGVPRSHGCVNMRLSDAKALWDLTDPRYQAYGARVPVKVTGQTPSPCPGDVCGYGNYCGDWDEGLCKCGDGWIEPREYCWNTPDADTTEPPAPGGPCWEGACGASRVCVAGQWRHGESCGDIVEGRICGSDGWCTWPSSSAATPPPRH